MQRASRAGVVVSPSLAADLAAYVGLLAKWNTRINLTGLDLEPLADETIDRLVVEALLAERLVDQGAASAIDIGSGGGSPAIPIKLARRSLSYLLLESKARKCAFLREGIRHLRLDQIEVINERFEAFAGRASILGTTDLITVRAVAASEPLLQSVARILRPGGQCLWFRGSALPTGVVPPSSLTVEHRALMLDVGLTVLTKLA